MDKEFQNQILEIIEDAGEALLDFFDQPIQIQKKDDGSPVTEADLASNQILCMNLSQLYDIPIISEENSKESNLAAAEEKEYWMIDPLDGTKAFLKKNKEFAICLALIKNGRPKYGFIHVPFEKKTYFNLSENNAYVKNSNGEIKEIYTRKSNKLEVLTSKRIFKQDEFSGFVKEEDIARISIISSAIKFTEIAEGHAQICPYFVDTMQWDTAAGDAIVHASGGSVLDLEGNLLKYGNINKFINPYFMVKA